MAALQNPHVPRRLWHSGESSIPMQVVEKQATVIVGLNKDAGRTNMKYITWLVLFFVLSCVFVAARNAHAKENFQDPKWFDYYLCLGYHYHLGEEVVKNAPHKDQPLASYVVRTTAQSNCIQYKPKEEK